VYWDGPLPNSVSALKSLSPLTGTNTEFVKESSTTSITLIASLTILP